MDGMKTMFTTTDEFYRENRYASLCVSAAAFAVWAAILAAMAAI